MVLSAFFAIKFKVPAAVAPVTAVGATMLYFTLTGCLGILLAGGYVYFAICILAVYYLCKNKDKIASLFFSPSFIFFCITGLLIILLFAYKKPLFMEWDEFSFWGTSVKLVKINNEMFTTAKIGWAWSATQKPALIMIGYFFEFFGSYTEWRASAGVDIFLFSIIAAIGSVFEKKDWHKAVPVMLAAFLTPYAFALYGPIQTPSSIYMSMLADIPLGMAFAAVFLIYYTLQSKGCSLWPVAVSLATLTMIKDTALPLAMVGAGIMCADIFLCKQEMSAFGKKGIVAKAINAAALFITPVVCFVSWAVLYLGAVLKVDATGDIGGTQTMSMVQMMTQSIKELLGIGTTEKFTEIMNRMYSSFFTINLTIFGSGLRVVLLVLAILGIAYIISGDKTHKLRCAIYAIFSSLGFVAYYLFIGFCYVFVFKAHESQYLMSYERYIYPYYMGWFLGAMGLLAMSIQPKSKRFFGVGQLAVFAVIVVMVLRLSNILTPGKTFVDFNGGYLDERTEQMRKSDILQGYIDKSEDSKIFFIGQGDDGGRWFAYASDVLPLQLDYSFGGGTICLPQDVEKGTFYYIRITPQELLEYIQENNCDYIFVEKSDDLLQDGFGDMFSDELSACKGGKSALYKVVGNEFVLVGKVD